MAIMPDKKFGKRTKMFLDIFCIVVSVSILLMILFGILLIVQKETEHEKKVGIILLSVGCAVFTIHLLIFIVQRCLKRRYVKRLEQRAVAAKRALGKPVHVTVDRKLGSVHPKHADIVYGVNYGYVDGVMGGDGEEQDAYILGVDEPIDEFDGVVIAVIQRFNDKEDKWVVAPVGVDFCDDEIVEMTKFQERFFKTRILRKKLKSD